ncbi:MAG: mevalonate kinase [Thermoproteota archaeon]|nr:mevalonate kinase [Thermoproteota archaeon]
MDLYPNSKITAISPGKTILFGEHFVVYGYPSIVAAINKKFTASMTFGNSTIRKIKITSSFGFTAEIVKSTINISTRSSFSYDVIKKVADILDSILRCNVNTIYDDSQRLSLDLHLSSDIPIGGGLGSSSALCVALAGAINYYCYKKIDKDSICRKSIDAEKVINKDTSGADCSICTYGGFGIYDKKNGFRRSSFEGNDLSLLIIDTGIPHNTFEMVDKVRKIKNNNARLFNDLACRYQEVFNLALKSLQDKDNEKMGNLMDENHLLLRKLGVSTPLIDKIVDTCNSCSSLGTKITGAGGGGCVISLIDKREHLLTEKLLQKLDEFNLHYFFSEPDFDGLSVFDSN